MFFVFWMCPVVCHVGISYEVLPPPLHQSYPPPFHANPHTCRSARVERWKGEGSWVATHYTPIPPTFNLHRTLHPTTCTPHPTTYTLHPTPYTVYRLPFTVYPTSYTLHPTPLSRPPDQPPYLQESEGRAVEGERVLDGTIDPRHNSTVGSQGGAVSYERGTPVPAGAPGSSGGRGRGRGWHSRPRSRPCPLPCPMPSALRFGV